MNYSIWWLTQYGKGWCGPYHLPERSNLKCSDGSDFVTDDINLAYRYFHILSNMLYYNNYKFEVKERDQQ